MISKRIQNMIPSATLEQAAKIAELKNQGIQIIGFNVGEPDYNTPTNIIQKAEEAYHLGLTKYTPAAGMVALREVICQKFRKEYGLDYAPKEVLVSAGAKQSLTNALMAIVDPGDEVIILTPCWVSYLEMVKLAEGVPVLVPLEENDGFRLDVAKIRKNISEKTKAIIINSPNNPTGAVYSKEDLRQLGQMAVEHDFYIISDEIYEFLVYEGEKNVCVAALSPEIKEKTITINGMSKAYAMTGWRIGYAVGPTQIIKGMADYQGNTTTSPNTPAQYASIEALANSQESVEMMRAEFDRRRRYILERINAMKNIHCSIPKGAFYVMPNVSYFYGREYKGLTVNNSLDLANYLLEEAKIAVVTGAAFEAPDNIRISYSNSMENIEKGMDRLEAALSKLK
ncbi:pyridoxal phosphate-dependent aminotransferase [Anoxynatronum buryatiense]|uniref:Aminotransferase n=1 Tax=Anoxynatronum buryatiense TaxID=489973 RepID=A0AA45WXC5_9CLOT|nr:pyridoxal phosphate-dependent aminotransferase [Anoxynatronum buryatiense]SMP63874.1 L-aspartate aminotransferase apoenzyme [Anoxynatronum buryatiense]